MVRQDVSLFRNRIVADVSSQDEVICGRLSPNPIWLFPLFVRTDIHTEGNEGRDCGDSTSQGMLKIASKLPDASGEAWKWFSLIVVRKNQLCWLLDLGLPKLPGSKCLLFKLSCLWCFTVAVLENYVKYNW